MSNSSLSHHPATKAIASDYGDLIRRCVDLATLRADRTFEKELAQIRKDLGSVLGLLWGAMGQMAAGSLSRPLQAHTRQGHAGYVFITKGKATFAVPFFLAELFPIGTLLTEIGRLAERAKIQGDSIICVSGSGCSLGLDIPVADLDFCEYLPKVDTNTVEGLIRVASAIAPDCICHRITVDGGQTWTYPWPETITRPTTTSLLRVSDALKNSSWRKVDFVAKVKKLGVLEVTNKLILVDFAYGDVGEGKHSFSFQEVPLDSAQWVPRALSDPLELGRYLLWLEKATQDLVAKASTEPQLAIKAIKRALSLGRILMANAETQRLVDLLKDHDSARLAALSDRCELYRLVVSSADPDLVGFKDELEATIRILRQQPTVIDKASYEALTLDETNRLRHFALRVNPELTGIVQSLSIQMRSI